ncbi:50S ribosomal protein L25/general stress protein Ctc [Fictibacillus iocasae]|uniref:Large ribosomal subunit protein bL25 n=1 Tax=Fictibacillus iocasae TaxID=2715437 RepID=A0ABW2NWA0_9BACL
MTVELQATIRSTKRRSDLTSIRGEGYVPAVLYGYGTEAQSVSVLETDFMKAYREVGKNGVIKLKADNKTYSVMVQEVQAHPLKEAYTHIDFVAVDMNKETEAEVPVVVTGEAPGVKEGGVLQRTMNFVSVKALPNDIPEQLEVSIEGLNIGDSVYVKDLPTGGSYEILSEENEVVASITPPTVVEEPETEEGDDDAASSEASDTEEAESSQSEEKEQKEE